MSLRRRRRYQSLGLMKRSHYGGRLGGPLEGVEKFVTESQMKDEILYNRVTRARPTIRRLEFAEDDVDWQLEYVCGVLGKWFKRWFGWLLGILESFMRFLGFRRKTWEEGCSDEDDAVGGRGTGDGIWRPKKLILCDRNHLKFEPVHRRIADLYPERIWRYENCIPFLNRRVVKRKWLLNPRTREWAEQRVDLFQKHVTRGFRTLCSGIGKDMKIYVTCLPSEAGEEAAEDLSPRTYIFRADSKVLRSHSRQFLHWFRLYENEKRVVTTFVTPQEMQALLVYMYTLTWPTDMMVRIEGKGVSLDPRFKQIFCSYGMSMYLEREIPPEAMWKRTSLSNTLLIAEPPPRREEDVNQNILVLNEVCSSSRIEDFKDTVLSPITQAPSLLNILGDGDCSNLSGTEILQYVTEKPSLTASRRDSATSPTSTGSSSDRSVTKSKLEGVKKCLRISPSLNRHRVYPETALLTLAQRSRLKAGKRTRSDFDD